MNDAPFFTNIEVACIKAEADFEAKHGRMGELQRKAFKLAFVAGSIWALAEARKIIKEA